MISPLLQKNSNVKEITQDKNQVFIKSERGITRITIYDEDIFRVSYVEGRDFATEQGSEFLPAKECVQYRIEEKEEAIYISTNELLCQIENETAAVNFMRPDRSIDLFSEKKNGRHLEAFDTYKTVGNIKVEEIKTADGVKKRITSADKEFDKSLFHTRLEFVLDNDEKIFGLGQAEEGYWNLRGTTQYLNQANKKIVVPLFVSTKGYGILFTTQSPSIFSDTKYGTYFYTTADYFLDYFIIAPEKKSEIVCGMRRLTGKALLPPKYAFGYVQSQERYESQREILDTVAEFKRRDIPLSTIVLDWLSWEDGMWGQKSFDKNRFPDVPAMIKKLHEDDVHFMISIWPSMDEKCSNYKEMKSQNKLLNGINIVNAFDQSARELYWKQAKEGLADFGVESWWCDSSEPITPEWNHMEWQDPAVQFAEYIQTTSDVMPVEKANAFGYYHAKGMFDGQKKDFPERRMLLLTRNGYVGSQKFGVTLWSGDISSTWETLQNQLTAAIQFSLSGIPYWTLDIGGFFVKNGAHWYWNGDYDDTTSNAGFRELYTRWFQFGAFLPMFRAHGTDCRREPWAFMDETNQFYDTIVDFIKLRYKLMPYIYSVGAKVWKDDEMFIRPLFTEFEDKKVEDIKSQYMFGPAFMVCPVLAPMYFDKSGKAINAEKIWKVYLPADCGWYDWWTGERYEGGQWIEAAADISKIPLFVREGCVVPVADDEPLRFPDANGNCRPFEVYEDDGNSYQYLDGKYTIKEIR